MSLEWNEEQTHFLIDERKTGNEVYHKTPKRSKTDFWEEISNKLNENNNTNYFTGEACNKKFLSLTRAYYTTKAYKEGSWYLHCAFIVIFFYERYTKKCLLFLEAQQYPNTVTPSLLPNTPSRRQPSRIPRSSNRSRLTTPSISRLPSSGSRPVTPSFFQSAETINIYINYNEPDRE
ncbi:unnamed protein product [Rhizophagus irregularis]|nr:unnamed protein product [Rhizophagus irregularis]